MKEQRNAGLREYFSLPASSVAQMMCSPPTHTHTHTSWQPYSLASGSSTNLHMKAE